MTAPNPARRAFPWQFLPTAAFVLFVAGAAWIAAGASHAGWFSDSVEYLILADFFRLAFGATDISPDAIALFRDTRFPPLFPLVLALGGAGTAHQQAAFVVTAITGVLAAAAAWAWIGAAVRDRAVAACLSFAAIACIGGFLLLTNVVSEPLYATLMFAAFLLAERPLERRWLVLAFLVAVLPLARTIGFTVVLGFCAWLVFQPSLDRRKRLAAAVIAILPLAAWMTFRAASGAHSYAKQLTNREFHLAGYDSWAEFLLTQPVRMVHAFITGLDPAAGAGAVAVVFLLVLPVVVGGVVRLLARRLDAFCIPLYLGVCWLWPYPAEMERFMLPLWPVYVLWGHTGIVRLLGQRSTSDTPRVLAAALVIAVIASSALPIIRVVGGMTRDEPTELAGHKRREFYLLEPDPVKARLMLEIDASIIGTLHAIPSTIPAGECFYAEIPGLARIHTNYRVVLLPPGLDATKPLDAQLPACEWIFVTALGTAQHQLSGGPLIEALSPIAEPVMASFVGENADDEHAPREVAAALLRRRANPPES
jgi:hypothetical protein